MVNPELINKVNDIYDDGGQTVLEIQNPPYFDKMPYDLLEEKSFKKYMTDLERSVRNSFEYRELISYLKNTEGTISKSISTTLDEIENNETNENNNENKKD